MDKRDEAQYVVGTVPYDLSATGPLTTDVVNMKLWNHIEIIIVKAAGASGEPPTFTVMQATDVTGANGKALNFTKLTTKVGTQTGIGAPTLTTQASGNTYAPAAGNTQVLAVIEFDAANLDVSNNFNCIYLTCADVGATAQVVAILFRLSEPRTDPMRASAIV